MTEDRFLLKDLFNPGSIGILADAVAAVYPALDAASFRSAVFDEDWDGRELKQRMRHTTKCLRAVLPDGYRAALAILVQASPGTADAGFPAMVLSDFVEAYGVEDFDPSVAALAVFTRVVSAEFAVRPFLVTYPERMHDQMMRWAGSDDPALRRLASEGTRPRLPWGMALKQYQVDPSPIIPLLEKLRHDPSADVRRSVANNLNDIARDHPDLVVETLTTWQDGSAEVREITRHALRVLVKKGHRAALSLLGFRPDPEVLVEELQVAPDPGRVGGKVTVTFTVASNGSAPQALIIDGIVDFARPSGTSTRVFKWKTTELEPGASLAVKRSVSLQQMSTRRVHPGTHAVEVQVNGTRLARVEFHVLPER